MAIEGDLRDMSLPNIVQTICLEQRKTALVLRRRRMEEGVLFFDDGEIVHATTGSLSGEEAVYQLLSWSEGTFRQSGHVMVQRQTIAMPWKHLLLEGMKRIDHREAGNGALAQEEGTLSPAEIEQDSALENELVLLLSRLEHLCTQLTDKRTRKRPAAALQAMTKMMNHAAAFAEDLDTEANAVSLGDALAMASDLYPAAGLLQAQNNRLSAQTVSKLYNSWSSDPAGRSQVFHQFGQATLDVLETYCVRFAALFRSPSLAQQWRETCRVFLTDLAHTVERIKF